MLRLYWWGSGLRMRVVSALTALDEHHIPNLNDRENAPPLGEPRFAVTVRCSASEAVRVAAGLETKLNASGCRERVQVVARYVHLESPPFPALPPPPPPFVFSALRLLYRIERTQAYPSHDDVCCPGNTLPPTPPAPAPGLPGVLIQNRFSSLRCPSVRPRAWQPEELQPSLASRTGSASALVTRSGTRLSSQTSVTTAAARCVSSAWGTLQNPSFDSVAKNSMTGGASSPVGPPAAACWRALCARAENSTPRLRLKRGFGYRGEKRTRHCVLPWKRLRAAWAQASGAHRKSRIRVLANRTIGGAPARSLLLV